MEEYFPKVLSSIEKDLLGTFYPFSMKKSKITNGSPSLLPTVFVIFGATGDLTSRKLVPALFHLYREGHLPSLFQVMGFARRDLSHEDFQGNIQNIIRKRIPDATAKQIKDFSRYFRYQQGDLQKLQGYKGVAEALGQKDGEWRVCSNKLFYLAVPPELYRTIFRHLAKSGLTIPCSPEEGWTRVIVEKPFGKDLRTAQELDRMLGTLFQEEQVYRIDHYLGKETVQNILAFRFSNSFLNPTWDNRSIESIHIKLWERAGIGSRGGFYDGIGALRDVGQNHILQLLALFTMENPGKFDAESVRGERAKIFRSLQIADSKKVAATTIRGQYKGYRKEKQINPKSQTETYFRIKTSLNTPRWKGMPIYLEGGKALKEDKVEVIVTFRHRTPCLCPSDVNKHYKNILHYRIQPKEGIRMTFWVKKPGPAMVLEEKDFSFDYQDAFVGQEISDAYERLLFSVIRGDQTLFVSTEEILAEWKFIDSILKAWKQNKAPLVFYRKHSSEITDKLL